MKNRWIVVAMMLTATTTMNWTNAQEAKPAGEPTRLPPVIVEEGKIYEGKKITVTEMEETPPVVNNNLRQAFTQTPGLLVSEQTSPSTIHINYRGIGDPHESEFLLTLRDGLPVMSDWFGYPTVYFAMPMESIQRVELIRGGSSLLYGPQPGPVLNYVTHLPPRDRKFTAGTRQTFGSYGLYSTYNSFGGTAGKLGYLGYFDHLQADGPRDRNSDYEVFDGGLKFVVDASDRSRWIFDFYGYASESGEAGRLSAAQYHADRDQTKFLFDRIWIERYAGSITFEHNISEATTLIAKGWGSYQDRLSRRQNSAGTLTNLDDQEFLSFGTDTRVQHNWQAWGNDHTLTGGILLFGTDSPRTREQNASLSATSGTPIFEMDRHTLYGSLFAENKFQFGRFGIIPAVRLEFIRLQAEENFNTGVTRGLIDDTFETVVPLGGIGFTFDLGRQNELYANVSRGYRPPKYDDLANPTSNTQLAPSDLEQGGTWNYEVGVRGHPAPWFSYDTSFFLTDFDGMIESINIGGGNLERQNSGSAIYKGWEAVAEIELLGLSDALAHRERREHAHQVSVFANASLLDAEFVDGNNDGNTPAYAPDYIVKTGAIYRWRDRVKVALTGTMVDEHFWQDSNAAGSVGTNQVAAYTVWDLTAEAKVFRDNVSVFAGINNLFDEDYYSRIRSDGIEPALRRNFYAGFKLTY